MPVEIVEAICWSSAGHPTARAPDLDHVAVVEDTHEVVVLRQSPFPQELCHRESSELDPARASAGRHLGSRPEPLRIYPRRRPATRVSVSRRVTNCPVREL